MITLLSKSVNCLISIYWYFLKDFTTTYNCSAGTFNDFATSASACEECFCFGASTICSSASLNVSEVICIHVVYITLLIMSLYFIKIGFILFESDMNDLVIYLFYQHSKFDKSDGIKYCYLSNKIFNCLC